MPQTFKTSSQEVVMENSNILAIETYSSTLDMWRSSIKTIMRESPQPYGKYYRQVRDPESERNGLSQGRTHQVITQFHGVRP